MPVRRAGSVRAVSCLQQQKAAWAGCTCAVAAFKHATQVKPRVILRDTWSKRQSGAMRPVPRAGWVWAASCAPAAKNCAGLVYVRWRSELELELIQPQMEQKPVLRDGVGARALRVRSVSREGALASVGVRGAWVSGCGCEADLGVLWSQRLFFVVVFPRRGFARHRITPVCILSSS